MARSRWERAGGVSIRELAVRHHVHRRTVRQALASAVPPPRKAYRQRLVAEYGASAASLAALNQLIAAADIWSTTAG